MKKIVVIPDSYKGSVSGSRFCEIVSQTVSEMMPDCAVIGIPAADGGEGTVDAFLAALDGKKETVAVSGPFGERMQVYYGIFEDFAVVEMASCAGLPLVGEKKNPLITTTYGVGEMILDAVEKGCREIVIGIGGSATNDAGCGMAAALGVQFIDRSGKAFVPMGGTLCDIEKIDISDLDPRLKDVKFTVMCDIDNPLYGKCGAAYVFGPQKGADEGTVKLLDEGLRHFAEIVFRDLGKDIGTIAGGGAAGGMGAGLAVFLDAELRQGIDVVLKYTGFEEHAKDADLVVTGEGRMDVQTLSGKVVCGVSKSCAKLQVPCVAIAGSIDPQADLAELGLAAMWDTVSSPMNLDEALVYTERNIAQAVRNMLGFYHAFRN
ncbi:MAG: glycerate kinase [Christensenellaceae bacterium]|nr:glycerate kinase [Christensenellaceae bacterium]